MRNLIAKFRESKVVKSTVKAFAAVTLLATNVCFALAEGAGNALTDPKTAVVDIVDNIIVWVAIAGAILGLWGGISLAMAIKDEDAQRKNQSVLALIAGIALVALVPIIWNILKGMVGL